MKIEYPKINPYTYAGLNEQAQYAYTNRMVPISSGTPESILATVCLALQVKPIDVLSPKRLKKLVFARFIAMREIRASHPLMPLKKIGKMFGRDHSTIIYGLEQYQNLLDFDDEFQELVKSYRTYR